MRTATGMSVEQLRRLRYVVEEARTFSAQERRQAAKDGAALPDGSYPIRNQKDLDNAVGLVGNGKAPNATVIAHIRKRAKQLNLKLPQAWQGDQ
jgi:hypothetical protein